MRRIGGGALALLTLGLVALVPSASGKSERHCKVVNVRTGQSYERLQEAVRVARKEDRLRVSGTCLSDTTIEKKLTISGDDGATLDGQNSAERFGSVVSVLGAEVTINSVTIRGGSASGALVETRPGGSRTEGGGGIYVRSGLLTLNSSLVTSNTAPLAGTFSGGGREYTGGGLFCEYSTCVVNGSAIAGNNGGGILAEGEGEHLTLTDSRVAHNLGSGVENKGTLANVNESMVTDNTGLGIIDTLDLRSYGDAGGATVTLRRSSVTDNGEGGAFNEEPGCTLVLIDSTIADNGGERAARRASGRHPQRQRSSRHTAATQGSRNEQPSRANLLATGNLIAAR